MILSSLSIVFLPNSLTNLLENSGLKIVIASITEPTGIPSMQENIIHTSDSVENAVIELNRFFKPEELFDYSKVGHSFLYATDEK